MGMINFKGIKFFKNKYGPFITIKSRILYNGFIPKKNSIEKSKFKKIIIKEGLNIIKQLNPSEPQHSLILGSILNPDSKHGYGDIFLKEFFNIVINDNDFIYDTNEKWSVTVEKDRFDISVRCGNNTKIIIIENKSNWAEDQPNQLYRYWLNGIYKAQHRLDKLHIPHWAKIIYLSPSYEKQYSGQSISRPPQEEYKDFPPIAPENIIKTVYYRKEVLAWLSKCMELVENTSSMYFYIKQYQDFWRYDMANDILSQVEDLFSDVEQWTSFLELSSQKDFIRNSWWQNFKSQMNKCFAVDNLVDGWGFTSWGIWDYRWFLKEFGDKSLCLWGREWYGNYSMVLWADQNVYDPNKISDLLQQRKYLPIVSAFERQDGIPPPDHAEKIIEHGNFQFGDTMDGHIDIHRLAWYAHYKSAELVSQILRKVDNFRRDSEITGLLVELNNETKIKK